ncbi:MAG TPA: hypothetical protein VEC57_00910 [Candidatus Limnocylindrales bacterium]|nr:hypothetical protein [Candidatus Limnocylindrales bacterium]
MRNAIQAWRAMVPTILALLLMAMGGPALAQTSSDTIGGMGEATGPGTDDRIHPRNPNPAVNEANDKARETVLEQNRGVNTNTDSGRPSSGAREAAEKKAAQ